MMVYNLVTTIVMRCVEGLDCSHVCCQKHSCCAQAGVALASAGELTFAWSGFISAMVSNLTFGFSQAMFSISQAVVMSESQ